MSAPQSHAYQCFSGVDIAAADFTAATLLPPHKAKLLAPKPFAQSADGFKSFIAALKATGFAPKEVLVVVVVDDGATEPVPYPSHLTSLIRDRKSVGEKRESKTRGRFLGGGVTAEILA